MKVLPTLAGLATAILVKWRLKHAISSVAVVITLALISMAMVIVVLVTGAYATYLAFQQYGMAPQYAALAVTAIMATAAAITLLSALHHLRRALKNHSSHPVSDRISKTIDAFIDGFMA